MSRYNPHNRPHPLTRDFSKPAKRWDPETREGWEGEVMRNSWAYAWSRFRGLLRNAWEIESALEGPMASFGDRTLGAIRYAVTPEPGMHLRILNRRDHYALRPTPVTRWNWIGSFDDPLQQRIVAQRARNAIRPSHLQEASSPRTGFFNSGRMTLRQNALVSTGHLMSSWRLAPMSQEDRARVAESLQRTAAATGESFGEVAGAFAAACRDGESFRAAIRRIDP